VRERMGKSGMIMVRLVNGWMEKTVRGGLVVLGVGPCVCPKGGVV
jgi:hypothetical protein